MNINPCFPKSPLQSWRRVEETVEEFEQEHRRSGSADPRCFCPPEKDPQHHAILRELLRADLEFAWSSGKPKQVANYRQDFPTLFADPESLGHVAFEEFRLRLLSGEDVSPNSYRDWYQVDTANWAPRDRFKMPSTWRSPVPETRLSPNPNREPNSTERVQSSEVGSASASASSTLPFPEPGATLFGFKIRQELGRGAAGRVYLAEQEDLAGRLVVIKVSSKKFRESQILARLQHSNIVPVYSTHSLGELSAFCMPYLGASTLLDVLKVFRGLDDWPKSGESFADAISVRSGVPPSPLSVRGDQEDRASTLGTILDRVRRMSYVETALWIGAELAEGLAYAYDRGIVHRDLKPANVLIADDGGPMLLDFNLAVNTRDGEANCIGGTLSHMAPEQLRALLSGQALIDTRCDVYSLGLILYELFAGRLPTDSPQGSFYQQVVQLQSDRMVPPPWVRALNPNATPAVAAIVAKCLDPLPDQRYDSPRHLAEDIRRHLADLPLRHAREPSLAERARKMARRNPWVKSAPFVGTIVVLSVATATGAYWSARRQSDRFLALTQLQDFRLQTAASRLRLSIPDPDPVQLVKDIDDARQVLAQYAPDRRNDWTQAPLVQSLGATEVNALRGGLADLLVSLAHAENVLAKAESSPQAREARRIEAERLNRFAERTLVDSRRRWVVLSQRASLLIAMGKPDEAKLITAALGQPEGADAIMHRAVEAYARHDYRAGLAILQDADHESISRADYWYAKGRCESELGDFAAAVSSFSAALALQPADSHRLYIARGQANMDLKDYKAAFRDFDDAVEHRPGQFRNHLNRALARFRNGDCKGAIEDLDVALQLQPDHVRLFFIRAQVRKESGDHDGAVRDIAEGMKRQPVDEISWIARGVRKLNAKDAQGAVADFDEALKINPVSKWALQNKASALSENLGRTEEAIAVLDLLVERHPDYVHGRAGRGVLLARLGRRDAALEDAAAALSLDDSSFIKYQVAGIYALTSRTHPGDSKDAFRLLAEAFKEPDYLRLMSQDRDLDPIRSNPSFQALVDSARTLDTLSKPDPFPSPSR